MAAGLPSSILQAGPTLTNAGWDRRIALGRVAHLVPAFNTATLSLVRTALQKVTYESIAKQEDGTWYQHGLAPRGLRLGPARRRDSPRVFLKCGEAQQRQRADRPAGRAGLVPAVKHAGLVPT